MMFSKSNTRKLSILIIILVILTDVSVVVTVNSDESIEIMPLGDSITQGTIPSGDPVGYRQKLYLDLTNAGFNVDFVGTLSHGGSAVPPFDSDHEGHGGWHANQIRDNVYGWLVGNPADIVLLHIGTNDISWGDEDVTEVEDILNNIDQYETDHNKDITVILARIILRTDNFAKNETTKAFNNAVEQMAWDRIANGDDIIIVDMENALTYPDDMADSVHPNAVGYEKMADVWYDAVRACMPIADFTASPTSGPEPLTVSFTDTSTSHDGIMGWTWDFGDGQSSTEQNPTHLYAADGTYTVTLTVLEEDGDDDVKIKMNYITVTDTAPTADFSYLQSHAALTIDFTDQSTSYDDIDSWTWNFGDGETSAEQNPTHKFPDYGGFNVALTVTDADGSTDMISKQVFVLNVAPTADFNIVSSEKPTVNEDISFIDQSFDPDGYIVSWFWDFGDGNTSPTQNVTHGYQALGTYIVSLNVTDNYGATDTVSKNLTIFDVIPPVAEAEGPSMGIVNVATSFDGSGSYDPDGTIVSYHWDFGDGGTGTGVYPTHTYITTGTYTVTLTVIDDLGATDSDTTTITITITIIPPPNKPPTAYFICSPSHPTDLDTIQFTDQSHDSDGFIASRHWSFGDGSTSSELNPTHRYADDGEYVVTLAVTDDDGATSTMNGQIMVLNVPPKANFTISPLKPTPHDIIQFSDQSSDPNGLIVSWNWDFGDGTTSIDPKPVHKYQNLGTYMINLTVTDDDGATNMVSKSITIYDLTPPDTKNNYDDNWHSKDFTINLTATDDYTGVQGVYYRINDGPIKNVSIDGHPIITTEDANNTLEYWSVDMAGNEENHHILTDIKLDKTSPIANGGGARTVVENIVVNFDASGSFDDFRIVDYEWDFGDGYLGKGLTTAHTYTQPGTYILALTVKDASGNKNTNSVSIIVLKDTDRDVIPDITDPDDDNDGIPDTWEITHGLDPLEASDAFLDPDGDGLNNFEEYSRGTDLNSYFSPFPLWIIALTVALVVGFALILISIRYTRLLHKKSSYKSEHPKKM